MRKLLGTLLWCAAASGMAMVAVMAAAGAGPAPLTSPATAMSRAHDYPETFVVHAGQSGETATITIPVGAVCNFSADRAEALVDYADPKVEAMRLSGDVLIRVRGTNQPIRIEADRVVLELAADQAPDRGRRSAPIGRLRSTEIIVGGNDTQTFVGNVSFTVPTSAGTMHIRADRVEHRGSAAGV